jgi:hypothetical protein
MGRRRGGDEAALALLMISNQVERENYFRYCIGKDIDSVIRCNLHCGFLLFFRFWYPCLGHKRRMRELCGGTITVQKLIDADRNLQQQMNTLHLLGGV